MVGEKNLEMGKETVGTDMEEAGSLFWARGGWNVLAGVAPQGGSLSSKDQLYLLKENGNREMRGIGGGQQTEGHYGREEQLGITVSRVLEGLKTEKGQHKSGKKKRLYREEEIGPP